LKRRVDIAESEGEKKELLFRQARLSADVLSDEDGAIAVYETILDLSMEPAAVAELEKLYRVKSRWRDLLSLYERQLETGGAAAELHVKIATIARRNLSDIDRAFDELGKALDSDTQHAGAIAELESILKEDGDPRQRARAAEMLEPVYQGRG